MVSNAEVARTPVRIGGRLEIEGTSAFDVRARRHVARRAV